MSRPRLLHCILLILLVTPSAFAQPVDSIRANPDAVPLRRIWSVRGEPGAGVGEQVAALWDIDGDGRDEFGVMEYNLSVISSRWTIYGLDSDGSSRVLWQHRAQSPEALSHGDFRGDGRRMLVFPWTDDSIVNGRLYFINLHDVDDGRIRDTATYHWHSRVNGARLTATRFHVADLDLDGADELILTGPTVRRGDSTSHNGELWIYRGGPDFQLDTPTVIVRDAEPNGGEFVLHVGRLDADEYPDLLVSTDVVNRVRWGGADILSLVRPIDRQFERATRHIQLFDGDGDGRSDLLSDGDPRGVVIHLSGRGKNARTRSYDIYDADRVFVGRGGNTFVLGPLNDSANRHDMFGTNSALGDGMDLMFSGGPDGPNSRYDATYPFVRNVSAPAGDVNGDGWRDVICGDYQGNTAEVLGGGPYIPRDSLPASAIRDIGVDGRDAAITVWPNPATDVVHVAWRGDLARMPASYAVHDLLGRIVAHGAADARRGEIVWPCGDVATGAYLFVLYDIDGRHICSVPLVVN